MAYWQLNAYGGGVPTGGCGSPIENVTVDVGAKLDDVLASRLVVVMVVGLVV